jgi:hypothetical protein
MRLLYSLIPQSRSTPNLSLSTIVANHGRYLLDASKGPILSPLQAHYDISFACVAYLVSSVDLIDSSHYPIKPLLRVVEGFHSLQLYANAFWPEHVLEFALLYSAIGTIGTDPIMVQLHQLKEIHDKYTVSPADRRTESTAALDPRLDRLKGRTDLHTLLKQVLRYRQSLLYAQQNSRGDNTFHSPRI